MKSYSQAGQDIWVQSIIGDSGWFLDIGAYDGIEHSNTYALEQLGWEGICIDADADAAARCSENRRATTLCFTVGAVMLADLMTAYSWPRTIDYLSVDVEGMDLDVLRGHDFDRWPVRLITIEHNEYLEGPARKLAILDFLTARDFECVALDVVAPGYGCYESWYRHREH